MEWQILCHGSIVANWSEDTSRHHGMPCPQYVGGTGEDGENTGIAEAAEEEMMPDADPEDSEDEDVFDFEEVSGFRRSTQPQTTADWYGYRFVTFVDVSGIHKLPVVPCTCGEATEDHLSYFDLGLFPASYDLIKTAFTFNVLKDFRLSNLECKTTAYQYYSKLRRITSPIFPRAVINRYQELRRVSREFRNLKLWKMHGRGYGNQPNNVATDIGDVTMHDMGPDIELPNTATDIGDITMHDMGPDIELPNTAGVSGESAPPTSPNVSPTPQPPLCVILSQLPPTWH